MSVTVRELGPDDWRLRRELRLAALKDAPHAFFTTYEQAVRRDESEWRAWPSTGALFGAWLGDEPVGLVGVDDSRHEGTAYLFAMWVAPAARGTGAADRLLDAAAAWARGRAVPSILLEVAAGNDRAAALYRRYGFLASDDPTAMPGGTSMRLALG